MQEEVCRTGADVLVLDCLGYHQHHRDVLQGAGCPGIIVKCAGFATGGRTISLTRRYRLILRDRARSAPYIEASTNDDEVLFMLQAMSIFRESEIYRLHQQQYRPRQLWEVMAEGEYAFGTAQPEE